MARPSRILSRPEAVAVQLLSWESVATCSVGSPSASSVTLMLSGRLPSWSFASSQALRTVADVCSGL